MRMTAYLARERQSVFVMKEELEKYMLRPTGTEGVVGILAWSACDHEGRRRFAAAKREKTTLVANMEQCAVAG